MDLVLTRKQFRFDGIFGVLQDVNGATVAVTLEHAYANGSAFEPKIPVGSYTCQRSPHRLHGMTQDFETFQVMNVPGHSNILFHWGNYAANSDGCILVGEKQIGNMITDSRKTFAAFMALQAGLDSFTLSVT